MEAQKLFLSSSDDIYWCRHSGSRLASSETVQTDQMLFFSLEVDFIYPDLCCITLLDSIDCSRHKEEGHETAAIRTLR